MIERFFGSFNTFLIDELAGATVDASVPRKLGIDPAVEAIVTMSELLKLIAQFLYLYHIAPHSGIDAVPALDVAIGKLAASEPHRKRLEAAAAVATNVKHNYKNFPKIHILSATTGSR